MTMPAGMPLRLLLDSTERRSPLILTNSYGRAWTSRRLSDVVVKGPRPRRRYRPDVS
jgi:hypothetical protein